MKLPNLTWLLLALAVGPVRSEIASLDVYADGDRLHVLTATTNSVVFHQRSRDGGRTWSEPAQVDAGLPPPHRPHRGMDVQVAAAGQQVIAVWTGAGADRWGTGPLVTAVSDDAGLTWRVGPNPSDSGLTTGHGFADIAADDRGVFHLVWLDARNGRQGLRYARSADHGRSWSVNQTLDDETCECCWNTLAFGAGGRVYVVYRDRQPRDLGLMASADGGATWTRTGTVGAFGWEFDGCPHVGGALAVGQKLAALAWTGKEGVGGLYRLESGDDGRRWTEVERIGGPTARRGDLAVDAAGQVAVTWEERGRIWARVAGENRALSAADVTAAYPRVVAQPAGFVFFWTEKDAAGVTGWRTRAW